MLFTIILRVYYFFKLGNQPIWWDEGDYLSIAKIWALDLPRPEWWGLFTGMRPLLIPLIWAAMMKVGVSELIIRFITLLVPSILTVYLVYAVGRDLYNWKIGVISGFIMSVYWVHLFYTYRLLTDIPAMLFAMLTIFFFYSRYILRKEKKGLYLACFFGVLAFAARFPYASILVTCFLYLVFTEKTKFFKNKTNWKALLLILLFLSPYLIYFALDHFSVLSFYFGQRARETNLQLPLKEGFMNTFGLLPSLFGPELSFIKNVFLIFLIFGVLTFHNFFIGFDIFLKQKNQKFNPDFFVLLWIFIQLFFYVCVMKVATDRWLLMLMPPLFFITARGFGLTYTFVKKYSKSLSIVVVIFLILFGGYYQLNHTNNLILTKQHTYEEIKLAGLWLKENTPPDSKIFTASIVQSEYYSERDTYSFSTYFENNSEAINKDLFEKKVEEVNPDYLIINIFQPSGTPEWIYNYPTEKGMAPIKYYLSTKLHTALYGIPEGQPLLVIYPF
jgi:4-amino-4-deoxy-L-arabinose transferase-like glycosyltransferase